MDEGAVCPTDELALMEQLLGFPCSMSVDLSNPSLSSLAVMGTRNVRAMASVWPVGPPPGVRTPPKIAPATTPQLTQSASGTTAAATTTATTSGKLPAALPTAPRPRVRRVMMPAGSLPPLHRDATPSPALIATATTADGVGEVPIVAANQFKDDGNAPFSSPRSPAAADDASPESILVRAPPVALPALHPSSTVADGERPAEGEDYEDELEADPELWADAQESGTPHLRRAAHDQLPRGTTAVAVEAALRTRISVLQRENAALAVALAEAKAAAEASAAAAAAAEARRQAAVQSSPEGCAKCARRRARAAARRGSGDEERLRAKTSETVTAVAAAEVGSSISSSPSSSPPTPPRLALPVEAAAKALWALGETPTWALRSSVEHP
ncbi:hypothetical protein MMPV_008628 [Pyropia vietnamensis]